MFPGDIWGVSRGCLVGVWGYLSGIHGHRRRSDAFGGYLASQSLQYGAVTLFWHSLEKPIFFSSDHTETSKYQNVHMSAQQKWLGFGIFCFFKACQREIISTVAIDHPVEASGHIP